MSDHSQATRPVAFDCEGVPLQGMLHEGAPEATTGVLVIVGGPQYRVGSHRQFVLLSRALAARGFPVLRFDHRGFGDSGGEPRTFEALDADIRAALDALLRLVPGLRRVVIWGLCDAASAALFYAATDSRIAGLVLLNPWVRSQQTVAQAYLRGYYGRRLFDRQAWRDLLLGNKSVVAVLGSFAQLLRHAISPSAAPAGSDSTAESKSVAPAHETRAALVPRMRQGFAAFTGPILIILSGDDITAAEFVGATGSRAWRRLLQHSRVSRCTLEPADHTFSSRAWRDQVAGWTGDWLQRYWPQTERTQAGRTGVSAA